MSMERKIALGRGQGYGVNCTPWLYVHEVPSKGLVSRIKGWKTQRVHHTMSQKETYYLLLQEWNDDVIDIREQYPLLPLEETLEIAGLLGFKHPAKNQKPVVMTSDFLITFKSGMANTLAARAIKISKDLDDRRTLEKLEIERQYWLRRNIPWGIVTEKNMPINIVKNIQYLHPKRNPENLPVKPSLIPTIKAALEKEILLTEQTLVESALKVDTGLGLSPGDSLAVIRHLLATKQWHTDMSIRINPDRYIQIEF